MAERPGSEESMQTSDDPSSNSDDSGRRGEDGNARQHQIPNQEAPYQPLPWVVRAALGAPELDGHQPLVRQLVGPDREEVVPGPPDREEADPGPPDREAVPGPTDRKEAVVPPDRGAVGLTREDLDAALSPLVNTLLPLAESINMLSQKIDRLLNLESDKKLLADARWKIYELDSDDDSSYVTVIEKYQSPYPFPRAVSRFNDRLGLAVDSIRGTKILLFSHQLDRRIILLRDGADEYRKLDPVENGETCGFVMNEENERFIYVIVDLSVDYNAIVMAGNVLRGRPMQIFLSEI